MRPLQILLLVLALPSSALADEGMWTFDNFPAAKVKASHGFAPDAKWLAHVRRASVRLAGGCSGSFVSPGGLVMTNHHCIRGCLEQLSTAQKNFMADGFYAKTQPDELRCPDMELNSLLEITDVTRQVTAATEGLEGQAFNDRQKAETAKIEKACAKTPAERCDVVSLYNGGLFHLYRYQRFQDVRVVLAPELEAAKFGGDPDNFNFPRYGWDASFIRAYENGKPAVVPEFLSWSKAGAKEGDLVFVSGHPGGTERLATVAQLVTQRDHELPSILLRLSNERGLLGEFRRRGPEERRIATNELLKIENHYKAIKGRFQALVNPAFFEAKIAEENDLKKKLAADPDRAKKYLPAYDAIAAAQKSWLALREPVLQLEGTGFVGTPYSPNARAFDSNLFVYARLLLRGAAERDKPQDQRLREYRDANLTSLTQRVVSPRPIYDSLEIALLTESLEKLREELGADDPVVKKTLGKQSPEEVATAAVKGSQLRDPALRKKLWEGGAKEVDASQDPMIALARLVDADARAFRKRYEDEVEAVEKKNGALLARARFELFGTGTYPDATFTLRLSYGTVKGWEEAGRKVEPITTFSGAFARHTGREPFALAKSFLAAEKEIDPATPFDLCTTNDIIGGNSGSPMVDREGKVVGLIFDGNLPSLGGRYGFDPGSNRAVGVHSVGIQTGLSRIYAAERVAKELGVAK